MQMNDSKVHRMNGLITENSGIPLKFVNENGLNVAVIDACNCDNLLDIEAAWGKYSDVIDSTSYYWECSQLDLLPFSL